MNYQNHPGIICTFMSAPTWCSPRVVLVINNNIYVIGLMNIDDRFMKRSMFGMARISGCGPLKIQRRKFGKASRLHFWLSDPRSH